METLNLSVTAEHKSAVIVLNVDVDKGSETDALAAISVAAREAAFRLGFRVTQEGVSLDER